MASKKPKQYSLNKKWKDLSLKQRDYVIEEARSAYEKRRLSIGRPLTTQEKRKLAVKLKLRCWVPPKVRREKLFGVFDSQESRIQKRLIKEEGNER